MLSPKKLIKMVRKWQKVAALGRRRLIMPGKGSSNAEAADHSCSSHPIASRGHVFVYTTDGERFMVPLKYLSNNIFRELLRISEEEFGLPTDGPLTLPCEAASADYIISLFRRRVIAGDVERAVLASIAGRRCITGSVPQGPFNKQMIYGF